MAYPAVILAHRHEVPRQFGHFILCRQAHHFHDFAGFRACLCTQSLIRYSHEFFGITVQNHVHRGISRSCVTVHLVLSVIPETGNKRDSVNVPGKMGGDIGGDVLDQEREVQYPNRTVPSIEQVAYKLGHRQFLGFFDIAHRSPHAPLE